MNVILLILNTFSGIDGCDNFLEEDPFSKMNIEKTLESILDVKDIKLNFSQFCFDIDFSFKT